MLDVLLGFCKQRLLLVDDVLVGLRIDLKEYISLFQGSVWLNGRLDHLPLYIRHHRRGCEIDPLIPRMRITAPSSAASSCGCGVGRIMCSWKATVDVAKGAVVIRFASN
jgi:hypothetical protein